MELAHVGLLANPVHVNVTTCGLSGAVDVIVNVPVNAPDVEGVHVTLTVQNCPWLTVVGQLFDWLKLADTVTLVIEKGEVPTLDSLTVNAGEVAPIAKLPNVNEETEVAAEGTRVPVIKLPWIFFA